MTLKDQPNDNYVIVNEDGLILDYRGSPASYLCNIQACATESAARALIKRENFKGCNVYKILRIEAVLVKEKKERKDGHRSRQRKLGNNVSR